MWNGAQTPKDNNPASVLTEADVSEIRRNCGLSPSVVLKRPLKTELAADARPDEIVVYELFFASGLRETVPSLVAKMANHFSVSPGQFTPAAWRLLIAIQTFGELESMKIGVEEVLYAYYFLEYAADPGRYAMHTRHHPHLVTDFPVRSRRKIEEDWRDRYLFMKVGYNPGFPTAWFLTGVSTKAPKEGKAGASKVVKYQLLIRSVEFLTSKFALENSTIWGFDMLSGQRRTVADVFASYLAASGKLTETDQSASLHAGPDSTDEVQCLEVIPASKRKACRDTATSSLRRPPKFTRCSDTDLAPISHQEILTSTDLSLVIEELKSKVFPHGSESLDVAETTTLVDGIYTDLLKAMSTLHFVEKKLSLSIDEAARVIDGLKHDLVVEKERASAGHVSKDKEIISLERRVQERDQTILGLKANASAWPLEKESLVQEIAVLKKRNDVLKYEKDFYLDGATIIARWDMMREWLLKEHTKWNFEDADMQYVHVKKNQANYEGAPPPEIGESLTSIAARVRVLVRPEHYASELSPVLP